MEPDALTSALREVDPPVVDLDRARQEVGRRAARAATRHRLIAVVTGIAVLAAVGVSFSVLSDRTPADDPVTVTTAGSRVQVIAPYDGQVTFVDPSSGTTRTVPLEIGVGDPPVKLAPLGTDFFVYYGEGIRRIDRELRGPWYPQGDALFFLKSTERDQVWLIERASETEPERFAARAVDVEGRIVVERRVLPVRTHPYFAGGEGSLVLGDRGGLVLYDVRTGTHRRIAGASFNLVDSNAHGVAWLEDCEAACRRVRFLDLRTGRTEDVVPAGDALFDGGGEISPDGTTLALIARGGEKKRLVLVRRGESPYQTDAQLSDVPQPTWSPDGSEVYYLGPELDRLRGYDVARRAHTSLDVRGIKALGLFAAVVPDATRPSPTGLAALGCARGQGQQLMEVDWSGRTLRGSNLACAQLQRARLTSARLVDADLSGAVLIQADFTDASIVGTSMAYARGYFADFTGATFDGANLLGAEFPQAKFDRATWRGTTCPDGTNSDAHSSTCIGHLG